MDMTIPSAGARTRGTFIYSKTILFYMNESYIAGFFDGEGSAMVVTSKAKFSQGVVFRIRPIIKIAQKNRFVLDKIKRFLGFGYVDSNPDVFDYVTNGNEGVQKFATRIAPYAIIKRDMLLLVKELASFSLGRPRNVPYSREETLKMLELRDRVFSMNQRNRSGLTQKYPKEVVLQETTFIDIEKWISDRSRSGMESLKAYAESIKKPRDLLIECACGCGGIFPKYDAKARERKYISGHNQQGKHWKVHKT